MLKRIILVLIVLLASVKPVSAETEFITDYQVSYTVQPNGQTHAKFSISLTNKISNIYASEFSLSIGSPQLTQVKTYQSDQILTPQVNQGSNTTNIIIPFPDKILGKDKTRTFNLEFESPDFATQMGNVWEISIPKLSQSGNLNSYSLSLSIPQAFGQPSIMSPVPTRQEALNNNTIYYFTADKLKDKGISATFGTSQFFDFSLNYDLINKNLFPVKTVIALPPDTSWQKIFLNGLEPKPETITVDQDGNWLAHYQLNSKQTLSITATGSAQLLLQPRQDLPVFEPNLLADYLTPQPYWQSDNPKIKALAEKLISPDKIYAYVVSNLIYDYGRLTENNSRLGAADALDSPESAICTEFTDLFIALTRAAGIPSRAINGYAYTVNSTLRPLSLKKDVLHAWPEYYDADRKIWVPVDPTWGNTTGGIDFFNHFDLNHFAFAILGKSSTSPAPAGAYKINGSTAKQVQIDFGKPAAANLNLAAVFQLPSKAIAGISVPGKVIITNQGNTALYNQTVNLESAHFSLAKSEWTISVLPPLATYTIDFELKAKNWLDEFNDTLTVTVSNYRFEHQLKINPVYTLILTSINLIFLTLIALALISCLYMVKLIYAKFFKRKLA